MKFKPSQEQEKGFYSASRLYFDIISNLLLVQSFTSTNYLSHNIARACILGRMRERYKLHDFPKHLILYFIICCYDMGLGIRMRGKLGKHLKL